MVDIRSNHDYELMVTIYVEPRWPLGLTTTMSRWWPVVFRIQIKDKYNFFKTKILNSLIGSNLIPYSYNPNWTKDLKKLHSLFLLK